MQGAPPQKLGTGLPLARLAPHLVRFDVHRERPPTSRRRERGTMTAEQQRDEETVEEPIEDLDAPAAAQADVVGGAVEAIDAQNTTAFAQGDIARPLVTGSLYNGTDSSTGCSPTPARTGVVRR